MFTALMDKYKADFYIGDYQVGGKTRINHLNGCVKHDPSSTYVFEVA